MGIVDVLLAVLYPPACPGCRRALHRPGPPRFCGACRTALGGILDPCPRCAEPAASPLCSRCAARPPSFRHAVAAYPYREDGVLAKAIHQWKYRGDLEAGRALEEQFAHRTETPALCYDLVVPVPLHPARFRQRGFNQAALLARALVRAQPRLGALSTNSLRRTGGATQARLGRVARWANAPRAFSARGRVSGKSVLLVDDVLTTGATASACAATLVSAGAALVDVAVLARTPRGGHA